MRRMQRKTFHKEKFHAVIVNFGFLENFNQGLFALLYSASPTQWCVILCGVRLNGVLYSTKSDSTVCYIVQSPIQRCVILCGVQLNSVLYCEESDPTVCYKVRSPTQRCVI